jgi:mono/diheme cytochrome c family protein
MAARTRVVFGSGFVMGIGMALAVVATAQRPARTVWSGVYTEAQAARGQDSYREACGYCHRDNLTGGGSEAGAPALIGPVFIFRWLDQPLADMFITIGTTMPENAPDTLTPQTVADIVSFLLKANDMPPGPVELPADVEALRRIVLTERPSKP